MDFAEEIDEDWGPKKLRKIVKSFKKEFVRRTPIAGRGILISEDPSGIRIEAVTTVNADGTGDTVSSGGGTSVDLYGSLNGAPAVFHLKQSSPPTLVNPEEE